MGRRRGGTRGYLQPTRGISHTGISDPAGVVGFRRGAFGQPSYPNGIQGPIHRTIQSERSLTRENATCRSRRNLVSETTKPMPTTLTSRFPRVNLDSGIGLLMLYIFMVI